MWQILGGAWLGWSATRIVRSLVLEPSGAGVESALQRRLLLPLAWDRRGLSAVVWSRTTERTGDSQGVADWHRCGLEGWVRVHLWLARWMGLADGSFAPRLMAPGRCGSPTRQAAWNNEDRT
jgi:hypothetical protein